MINSHFAPYVIPDDVTGFDEIWVIGEKTFMQAATKFLRPMINNGRKQDMPPYFTSRYDVYWQIEYDNRNIWSQIKNAFVNLLNKRWKLPNYLVIIFSNKCVNDTLHYAQHLYIPMNALGDFVNRMIFERTTELPTRALRAADPQVMLIKTVSKLATLQDTNNFKNKRRPFNKAVQKLVERNHFRSINIDEIMPGKDLFEKDGELSPVGFSTFWNSINLDIKQNDVKRLNAYEEQMGPIPTRSAKLKEFKLRSKYDADHKSTKPSREQSDYRGYKGRYQYHNSSDDNNRKHHSNSTNRRDGKVWKERNRWQDSDVYW